MTGLLVSVRDASEAQAAIDGGVDLIDVKEPRAGSLGPADVVTWQAIAEVVGETRPLSVALGELQTDPVCDLARQAGGMKFAKIGLANCCDDARWEMRWREAIDCLPAGVASVAVIYADYLTARSPTPATIVRLAACYECEAVLFDTHSKQQGHLFDHLAEQDLTPIILEARKHGLKVVMGGSLRGDLVCRVLELGPDYVAVRGAVCRGDRNNQVDRNLIESLADTVHANATLPT
jgi:(5-formylfuran-3-yl)methyl phosphate synthase